MTDIWVSKRETVAHQIDLPISLGYSLCGVKVTRTAKMALLQCPPRPCSRCADVATARARPTS